MLTECASVVFCRYFLSIEMKASNHLTARKEIHYNVPSGMSHATIAISARTHNMKFGTLGYSFLQCSAKCFPASKKWNLYKLMHHWSYWKKISNQCSWYTNHIPVTTPRLAARDWIIRAAHEATKMIQSNCNRKQSPSRAHDDWKETKINKFSCAHYICQRETPLLSSVRALHKYGTFKKQKASNN